MNKREYYLDNIRVFLTLLVIAHHTCQAYTPQSGWIVTDTVTTPVLSSFLCVNMMFFMSAFFFIAGYFIPKSLEKRSAKSYLWSRSGKLLRPLLLLLLVIVPIYRYFAYLDTTENPVNIFNYYISTYWGQGQMTYDHGWFILNLFLYSVIYILIRQFVSKIKVRLSIKSIAIFILIMSVLTGVVRIFYSIDTWVNLLGFIGFEPAHLPQYFMWFLAGTLAASNNWMEQISNKMGRICIAVSAVIAVLVYIRLLLPTEILNALYFVFFIIEPIMSVTVIVSMIYLFRRYWNKQGKLLWSLSKCSFYMYVVHNFYVILFQIIMRHVTWNVWVKFICASTMAILCSYLTVVLYFIVTQGVKNLIHREQKETC